MKIVRAAAMAAVGLTLAAGSTAVATAAPSTGDAASTTAAASTSDPGSLSWNGGQVSPDSAACHFRFRVSKHYAGWTAGHSWAWKKIVGPGSYGGRVKEVQCLTRWEGFKPGSIDGIYGTNTEKAVKRAQRRCHIRRDGVVGPKTWYCIRVWIPYPERHV